MKKTDGWKSKKTNYYATKSCTLNTQGTLGSSQMKWINPDSPGYCKFSFLIKMPAGQFMSALLTNSLPQSPSVDLITQKKSKHFKQDWRSFTIPMAVWEKLGIALYTALDCLVAKSMTDLVA